MAIIASVGFMVSIFDLTYIPCRDFYFRNLPLVVQTYDRFKGIEPNRETERYLNAVEQLKLTVQQAGLGSAPAQSWLQELDTLSTSLIQNNPFQVAGKTGNLEKIKNDVRDRVQNQSAKGAFSTFWSQAYLTKAGWDKEIQFYDRTIKPLLVTNYYRRLNESGNYVDNFWQIDIIFISIFAGELLGRTFFIRRRNRQLSWQQVIIRRWYDLILLLPFAQFLRIIPVIIRLQQAKLIDLTLVKSELNRLFVGQIASELTETVVLEVLQQTQGAIRTGQITKVVRSYLNTPHIDLNNINEIEVLIELMLEILAYRVIPKIQPDLEAILRHLFQKALSESPAYRNLQMLPGIGELPTQAIDRVVKEISASIYTALTKVLEDPDSAKLSRRFVENITKSIGDEMQRGQTIIKIESLLYDLLEEVRVTYSNKQI
jgi:outer membrane lipopolysaccharide assembly protein LptE/RlpB